MRCIAFDVGVSGTASMPLDRFNRIEFGVSWMNLSKENMDFVSIQPDKKRTLIIQLLSYVHDNYVVGYNFTEQWIAL